MDSIKISMEAVQAVKRSKLCSEDCPFSLESEGVDFGCLPSVADVVNDYIGGEGIWACHSNNKKPCSGLTQYLENLNKELLVVPGSNI